MAQRRFVGQGGQEVRGVLSGEGAWGWRLRGRAFRTRGEKGGEAGLQRRGGPRGGIGVRGLGVRSWGGSLQAAEFVFVVGELVGWGGQFVQGAEAEEELQDGDGKGVEFTCGGGFVGQEADLLLEFEGALRGWRGGVGDVGAASLAHAAAGDGGGGWHGWGWGGHVCGRGGGRGGKALYGCGIERGFTERRFFVAHNAQCAQGLVCGQRGNNEGLAAACGSAAMMWGENQGPVSK